jgi:hypothetical protein
MQPGSLRRGPTVKISSGLYALIAVTMLLTLAAWLVMLSGRWALLLLGSGLAPEMDSETTGIIRDIAAGAELLSLGLSRFAVLPLYGILSLGVDKSDRLKQSPRGDALISPRTMTHDAS